jgi:DNA invertase Pin-like site-specific DNA recombinase
MGETEKRIPPIMNAAIYARVSTEDQHCDMQLRELREYCARRKWSVAVEYVDRGWSGVKVSRPELNRCMAAARLKKFDCILVWKLDRWGRSLAHCVESIQELRSLGVRWIAATQNLDTDESSPMSRAMLGMMAVFAEFERELIRERVTAGLRSYKRAQDAGEIGQARHSHSGKDLAIGRPRRVFDRAKAERLRKAGKSIRQIAAAMKLPKSTVHALFQSA